MSSDKWVKIQCRGVEEKNRLDWVEGKGAGKAGEKKQISRRDLSKKC